MDSFNLKPDISIQICDKYLCVISGKNSCVIILGTIFGSMSKIFVLKAILYKKYRNLRKTPVLFFITDYFWNFIFMANFYFLSGL